MADPLAAREGAPAAAPRVGRVRGAISGSAKVTTGDSPATVSGRGGPNGPFLRSATGTGVRSVTPGAVGCRHGPSEDHLPLQECGAEEPKWAGRCPACEAWGTLVEERRGPRPRRRRPHRLRRPCPCPIAEVDAAAGHRAATGVGELDRVLGGGLVPGLGHPARRRAGHRQVHAAAPGAGRAAPRRASGASTSRPRSRRQQVRLRAERLGALPPHLWLVAETALPHVLGHIDAVEPRRGGRRLDPDRVRPRAELGARARWPRCGSARTAWCARPRSAA